MKLTPLSSRTIVHERFHKLYHHLIVEEIQSRVDVGPYSTSIWQYPVNNRLVSWVAAVRAQRQDPAERLCAPKQGPLEQVQAALTLSTTKH
jgi:hypothetical protein